MNLLRGFVTLAALLLFNVAATAQAVPGASSTLTLEVFLGATNAGLTAGATLGFHPFFYLTPALEVRGTLPIDQGSVDGQKNVVGGLQVATQLHRVHSYANILFGRGEITYLKGGIRFLASSSLHRLHDNVLSPGAGIGFALSSPWSIKLATNTSATRPRRALRLPQCECPYRWDRISIGPMSS